MNKLPSLAGFVMLAVYAAPAKPASKPKSISYKEASSFEASLLSRPSRPQPMPEKLYRQPINKSEPCKLPTTQDQIDRSNFRAYWDGECKNGFAFGLGRDIAISGTHHIEEITIHDGTGNDWSQPRVDYDYVNNVVVYGIGGAAYPAQTSFIERMVSSLSGFEAYRTLNVTDTSGRLFIINSFAFNPQRIFINSTLNGTIAYRFTDNSAAPVTDQNAATFAAETIDPQSNAAGGVTVVRYATGSVRNFRVAGGTSEAVALPTAYTDHLQAKLQEVVTVTSRANMDLSRAQQIEREYLFKACNGKSGIKGLASAVYTKVCTWRDQFKGPYAAASAKYQLQLEDMKRKAATVEQQNQLQLQIALDQRILQDQQNQQLWNDLNQSSLALQQQTQQTLQGIQNWQAPRVQPISPYNGNRITCHQISIITACR